MTSSTVVWICRARLEFSQKDEDCVVIDVLTKCVVGTLLLPKMTVLPCSTLRHRAPLQEESQTFPRGQEPPPKLKRCIFEDPGQDSECLFVG